MSPRARDLLQAADLVLTEDTRRTGQLFALAGLTAKKLLSFHEHNEAVRLPEVLRLLREGRHVALVSDAGTPLIADPGYRLVRACRKENLPVSSIPGPSAPITALAGSGLPPLPFTFAGFLPRGDGDRRALFEKYARLPGSFIFFERKDRLQESLELAYQIFGPREVAICRELTKMHEEYRIGRLDAHAELTQNLLGEITVIIGPAQESAKLDRDAVLRMLQDSLAAGLKPRKAIAMLLPRCPGWTGSELYNLLTEIKRENEGTGL